jgi:hypothetical protein
MHLNGSQFIKAALILMITGFFFIAAGSGESALASMGDSATHEKYMVHLKDGNQQGIWKTNELAVKYKYQLTHDNLKIDGTVELVGGFAIGFNYIKRLAVNLVLLDNQGNIIKSILIFSGQRNLTIPIPMRFENTIPVPGGAQTISFSYDGELLDSNHRGSTSYDIWFSPT